MIGAVLTCGINAYQAVNPLRGTIPDAEHFGARLMDYRARGDWSGKVRILLDRAAHRQAIRDAIGEGVARVPVGGTFVLHFSGHGTQAPDTTGDEGDHLDEALCPYDLDPATYWPGGLLSDDALAAALPRDRLTWLIVDACHSGTASRSGVMGSRGVPYPGVMPKTSRAVRMRDVLARSEAPVILFAACESTQTAADFFESGCTRCQSGDATVVEIPPAVIGYHGALTMSLLSRLWQTPTLGAGLTFEGLADGVRQWFAGRPFSQRPTFEATGGARLTQTVLGGLR